MTPVPSLRIWACSFAVVVVLFGVVLLLDQDPVLWVLNHKRITRHTLEENNHNAKNQIVVSIGSSLTRHAIYYDDVMDTFARQNGYDNLSFTRFVLGGAVLSQFYPLFDHIIAAKPDIVLFQHSYFAYKKKFGKKYHGKIHSYRHFFKSLFKYAITNGTGFKRYSHNREQQEEMPLDTIEKWRSKGQTPSRMKQIERRRRKWSLQKIDEIPNEFDQFLKQAVDAGIKVIILNLPRPEQSKDGLPATEQDYRQLMEEYENKYHVTYWHYPYQLGLESFIDHNHLTPTARKKYGSWLLKQLTLQVD